MVSIPLRCCIGPTFLVVVIIEIIFALSQAQTHHDIPQAVSGQNCGETLQSVVGVADSGGGGVYGSIASAVP